MAEIPLPEAAPIMGLHVHIFTSTLEEPVYGGGTDVSVSVWGKSLFSFHCRNREEAIALMEQIAKETKKEAALDADRAAKNKADREERRQARAQEPHVRYEIAAETYEDPCEHVH